MTQEILIFTAAIAVLFFFVVPGILMNRLYPGNINDSLDWMTRYGEVRLAYSFTKNLGMGKGLRYCPHPFTNWSLNPSYRNSKDELVHTREGFRKTMDSDSLFEMLDLHPEARRIVCVGGSTTYCTGIDRFQDTWPAKLQDKLKEKNVIVFNFGVGGWGITQSLIRLASWMPDVKPDLVVFYQLKNELSFFFNGAKEEKDIYPDYQNIIGQFSQVLAPHFPRWLLWIPLVKLLETRRFSGASIGSIYKPEIWANPEGLERFTDCHQDAVLFKTEALISLCGVAKCRVLYIPEILRSVPSDHASEAYGIHMRSIRDRLRSAVEKHGDVSFQDIGAKFPLDDAFFLDKSHFNEKGCEIFAELATERIDQLI